MADEMNGEREAFENWAIEQPRVAALDDCFAFYDRDGRYELGLVQSLWLAFQAGRASLAATAGRESLLSAEARLSASAQ